MWKEMARVVCEVGPEWVFVENSPMLTIRGLGTVLRDLAEIGFDAAWHVLSAADVGAPHLRERIWIVAHSGEVGRSSPEAVKELGEYRKIGRIDKKGEFHLPDPYTCEVSEKEYANIMKCSVVEDDSNIGNGDVRKQ
jgi:DNA (cytosine-5)-methyltransferase 1